ncbi:MAG TPA: sigma factor-like helix-turn-helix DNA-binding protein, partial [Verrucomicrobiae bacterium]|nr:sigma factor-like helix-turn-helix DNA-binding protein [Verrucomicrobiae bacterium]
LSGEGEKSWKRRPIAVLTVSLIAITLGTFTHLAGYTPWSPHMNAWSADPLHVQELSAKEAAQILGVPVGTVKARLHRARSRITQYMQSRLARRRQPSIVQNGCSAAFGSSGDFS